MKDNLSPASAESIKVKLKNDNEDKQVRWWYFQKIINQTGSSLSEVYTAD